MSASTLDAEADTSAERRRYALENRGDAKRGELFFNDSARLACANCHAIYGQEKCGPNLEGVGDKYSREKLIETIVDPNASILPGYETTILRTKDGEEHVGILYLVTKAEYRIGVPHGPRVRLPRADVVEQRVATNSIMPEGLAEGLNNEEFADLLAYLESLKVAPITGFMGRDQSVEIPALKKPVEIRPFHSSKIRFAGPVWFGPLPGRTNEFVVLEHQEGKIWRLEKSPEREEKSLFLDLSNRVSVGPVEGLMSIAFHPDFAQNRRCFLKHEIREDGELKTLVVERLATTNLLRDSGLPSRRLMVVTQPAYNHNGGCIAFGPDRFLYVGFGDGGPQRDPNGYCQDPREPLGSILRIDVDSQCGRKPYGIPADNPFIAAHQFEPEVMPETWAIGLREPWRFTFDSVTGDLWVADVGQEKFEEISIVRKGENHGWNVYEAFEPFSDEYRRADEKYSPPIFAYPHSFGVSVTGGYVYRAKPDSSFYGVYIFGDYESRRIWGLTQQDGKLTKIRELGKSPARISSFGMDTAGEIYIVGYEGTIYQVDFSATVFE